MFKAIAKKYPAKLLQTILQDLVASEPGQEGKWFAAAKDAGLFEFAIELVNQSATDPRTLIRAARDHAVTQPVFALAAAMATLHYIIEECGYDIASTDVLDACSAIVQAADAAHLGMATVKADIRTLTAVNGNGANFVQQVLARQLGQ